MSPTDLPDPRVPLLDPLIRVTAMPADTNPAGDIFGGWLMAHMDMAAGSAATRYSKGRCVTVAVESMVFLQPVLVGDEVSFYGEIVATGRTSMTVQVQAWRRGRDAECTGKVTEGKFKFVAIGADRCTRVLPDRSN